MTRIILDARISRTWGTGVGRYTASLLDALVDLQTGYEFVVLLNPVAPPPPVRAIGSLTCIPVRVGVATPQQHLFIPRLLKRLRADAVFTTHPFTTTLTAPCPAVAAVLDVYPMRFPDQYPRIVSLYYRTVFRLAVHRKQAVVTISEATRSDAVRYLGLTPAEVFVTHLAPATDLRPIPDGAERRGILRRYGLDGLKYVLYHGNKRAHKNLVGLLRAFAQVRRAGDDTVRLAITGREDEREREWDFRALRHEVTRLNLEEVTVFTGFVADDDLAAVYSGAWLVAIPSLVEGFGLPALESMACGTPVVASTAGALPEVVGDAGICVDPRDPSAIAQGMARLISDTELRDELGARGLARAATFSWRRTAQSTLNVVDGARASTTRKLHAS